MLLPEDDKATTPTPHDALIEALESVDEMRYVFILWTEKEGGISAMSSIMPTAQALFMLDIFKARLLREALRITDEGRNSGS